MQLMFEDHNKRTIHETEKLHFSGHASLYLVAVVARVKHKKQDPNLVDHESLSLQLDDHRYEPSFRGNKLKSLNQTVYILTQLQGQTHTLILTTGAKQKTATLERVQVFRLDSNEELTLIRDDTAEDGDRRPWIIVIIDNLPILSFTPTIAYSRRKRDSDDVKVKIDGKEQWNLLKSVKHFLWRFAGSLLPWTSPTKKESETFRVNLPQGLHTIEFEADRMPTLQSLSLRLSTLSPIPKRIPTVDDPTWTGDFGDDTDEMLLARLVFGEARSRSNQEKIAIAWIDRSFSFLHITAMNKRVRIIMSTISVLLLAATLFILKTQKAFHERLQRYEQENRGLKERSLLHSPNGLQTAYFQNKFITKLSQVENDNYVRLIVAKGEKEQTIFSGNHRIAFFEWLSDTNIAVYKDCGTECMIAYRITLPTLQTHRFYLGSGYTWSPNRKYVFGSLSVPQQVITIADAFGTSLFTLRREPLVISNTSVPHKALWSPDSSKLAILIGKESKEKLELIIFDVEKNFSLLSRHDIDPSSFRDFFWRDYHNVIYHEGNDERVIRV